MITKATDDLLKDLSKTVAVLLVEFGVLCLRAWLVSVCAGLFFPAFSLGFWDWMLVVVTFRLLISREKAE